MTRNSGVHQMVRVVRVDQPTSSGLVARGLLSMLGLVSQGATRVVTNLLIGRAGGPATLGLVASTISAAQFAALMWPASIGSAAAKFVAQARGQGDYLGAQAVAAHLARRTAASALVLATATAGVWVLVLHRPASVGALVGLLVLGYAGQSLASGIHYGAGSVARLTRWDIVVSLIGILGVGALLVTGEGGLTLLGPLALAALLQTVTCWPWTARGRPDRRLRREMDLFVTITTIGTLASSGFYQLSIVAAGAVSGPVGAGHYAAVVVLATPLLILTASLSLVLFPTLAEAVGRADQEGVREHLDTATRAICLILVPLVGVLALCDRSVMRIVWGPSFEVETGLFGLIMGAVFVGAVAVPSVNYLSTHSQRGAAFGTAVSVVGLTIGVAIWVSLGPALGIVGVALGYLLGKTCFATTVMVVTARRLKLDWRLLAIRLFVAAAALLIWSIVQTRTTVPLWADPLAAASFLAGWFVLSSQDTRRFAMLVRSVGRQSATSAPSEGQPLERFE
jgi:O-antigen/teichoic acid export membrane protein